MAKQSNVPGWVWAAAIVAGVAWIAREKMSNPRCKKCNVVLRALEVGSKYLCPECGAAITTNIPVAAT